VATELEARAEAARMLTEVVDGKHEVAGKHTFGELLDAWLRHVTPNLEPGTAALYGYAVGYVTPALRGKAVTKVTTEDLDALYRWLLDHGSTGGGNAGRKGMPLSAKTVRQVHSVIRLALAQGKKWHWLTSNVALDATPPAPRKRQVTPPTPQDLVRLLSLVDAADPEFSLFLRLAATAGPRRGEMCALRWSAIGLDQGTLQILRRVTWSKEKGRWEEQESTKTGKDRALVVGPRTLELLSVHRAQMEARALACGAQLREVAFVFSDEADGSRPWSPARVTRTFGAFRRKAGLPSTFRLHDLRAFLSTQLQEGGHPLPVVSGRLGHSQFSTTLNHYTGWMPAADRAAARYMDGLVDRTQ
jgi:integrase